MSLSVPSDSLDLAGHRAALEELRRTFDKVYADLDSADAKLQALLSAAGLLVAIAATLQVAILRSKAGTWFWVAVAGAMLVFAAMFALVLWATWPRAIKHPLPRTWDEVNELYFGETERVVLNHLVSDYLHVIEEACQLSCLKARGLRWAMIFFLVMIFALLAALRLSMS